MLAKKNRLTGSKDFKAVEKDGKVFQFSTFGLVILDRKDNSPSRFGFIVSTKIAKDAVDRNRIKRVLSETIRTSMVDLKDGLDVVFLAKTSILKFPTDKVMKEVKIAIKESGLLK